MNNWTSINPEQGIHETPERGMDFRLTAVSHIYQTAASSLGRESLVIPLC